MTPSIVIYRLSRKFVNQRQDVPETARQVVYYTLAVGHHVGVMDCFTPLAEISLPDFQAWLGSLPDSPGRRKMEGVLKWGEIEINRSHVNTLLPLLGLDTEKSAGWLILFRQSLLDMIQEPAFYLMAKKRP